MAKGIEIGVASETKAFKQGIEAGVIAPVEDAQEALEALGTTGGPEKLESSLESAQHASETLKKEVKDTADTIESEFRASYGSLRRSSDTGTHGAKKGMQDLKDESRQTARESAASFDGSAQSIIDAFQEVAANAFIGFGPAGLVAGLAAAAGIGLIASQLVKNADLTEKNKVKIGEMAKELIDAGHDGSASLGFIVDKLKELATVSEDGETNLKDLDKTAAGSKSSFKDLAQVYAGNTDQLADLLKQQKRLRDSLDDEAEATDTTTDAGVARYSQLIKQADALDDYIDYLQQASDTAKSAAEQDELYARTGAKDLERKAALIDAVNESYDDAAGSVDDFIAKESGLFDTAAYITAMQAREKALRDYQTTLASSALSEDAKSFLNEQGAEAAATFLAGYQSASPAQKQELNRIWSEAAKDNSGSYTAGLVDAFKSPVVGPTVVPTLDTKEVDRLLADYANKTLKVTVQLQDPLGKKIR